MNRIVGLETEYGCLVTRTDERGSDPWPVRIKNHLFKKARIGALDKHHRDYEEPPGNGGFLLNGGRFYLDMGHLDSSSRCSKKAAWVLEQWAYLLDGLRANDLEMLLGAIDWASKRWLLDTFRAEQGLAWNDPWLQSLDLEYHNINPSRGLFYAMPAVPGIADSNLRIRRENALREPPQDTRAKGRSIAVERFMETQMPYIVNWDSIAAADLHVLSLSEPFLTYATNVRALMESAMM